MKKLLAIAATFAASSAFAGVKLEVRSDYINTPSYNNNTGSEVGSTSLFTPSVARLYLTGNVGDVVVDSGWNLRAFSPGVETNPYTGSQNVYKNMTVDSFVDHLTAEKIVNTSYGSWSLKAGKLWMNVGGFERRLTWHGDTFLTSLANGGLGGTYTYSTNGTTFTNYPLTGSVTTPDNISGVSAAYSLNADQKIEVQVANQTNSQQYTGYSTSSSSDFTSTSLDRRHTIGVAYMGSFLNKMIQPYLSYTSGAGDTSTAGHEQQYMAAGLRLLPMENMNLDVEYFANQDKVSTSSASTSGTMKTTSMVAEISYNFNGWVPVLKYENSKNDNGNITSVADFKREAYSAAVEYVPKADEAFRYHIAYVSQKDKDITNSSNVVGNKDMTKNMIVVGFKWTGDIVK